MLRERCPGAGTHCGCAGPEPGAAPQQKALVVVELSTRELVSHLEAFESSRCGHKKQETGGEGWGPQAVLVLGAAALGHAVPLLGRDSSQHPPCFRTGQEGSWERSLRLPGAGALGRESHPSLLQLAARRLSWEALPDQRDSEGAGWQGRSTGRLQAQDQPCASSAGRERCLCPAQGGRQPAPSLPPPGLPQAQDQGLMRNPQQEGMLLGSRRG